jgi:hypothetical protein
MDSREAREILTQYRPGATEAPGPGMAEALDLVRRDPDLAAWFGLHCAAQTPAPANLRDLPVPQDARRSMTPETARPGPRRATPSRPVIFFLVVAGSALLVAIIWYSFHSRNEYSFALFRDRIVRMAQRSYPVKMVASDQAQIREYFRTNGVPLDHVQSATLEKLPGKGGAVFPWHNRPVSLLCLHTDDNKDLYLFTANRRDFPSTPGPGRPQYDQIGRMLAVSWSDAEKVYVLSGICDAAALQRFLR